MNRFAGIFSVLFLSFGLGSHSVAGDGTHVYLDLLGLEYKPGAVLSLGSYLKTHYPSADVSRIRLRKIVVEAKSPDGLSTVVLQSQGLSSNVATIAGAQEDYAASAVWTYSRVPIANPEPVGYGDWALQTSGALRIKGIHLIGSNLPVSNIISLGTFRTSATEQVFSIPVRMHGVKSIIVRGEVTQTDLVAASANIDHPAVSIALKSLVNPWIAVGQEKKEILPATAEGVFVRDIEIRAKAWISSQSSVFRVLVELAE